MGDFGLRIGRGTLTASPYRCAPHSVPAGACFTLMDFTATTEPTALKIRNRLVEVRVIAAVLETQLAVHIDGLLLRRHQPAFILNNSPDGHIGRERKWPIPVVRPSVPRFGVESLGGGFGLG